MAMQAQLMLTMMQHIQNQPVRGPPPVQVRDKRGEFMKGRLLFFSHTTDPMQADDLLKSMEKQLVIA